MGENEGDRRKDAVMGRPRKEELRERTEEEQQTGKQVVKASSARVDAVKRAKALLAVAAGPTFPNASQEAGFSREAVAQTVRRFKRRGLAVLETAAGRGRRPTSTSAQRARILAEVQREADRDQDQTATWSLMRLRRALRATDLPHICTETLREVLHEAGSTFGNTRTGCPTGTAIRRRQTGVVTVQDPAGPEKTSASIRRTRKWKRQGERCGSRTRQGRLKRFPNRASTGTRWANRTCCPMSSSVGARRRC